MGLVRKETNMFDYNVRDVLCNTMAQLHGYVQDIDAHGVRLTELVEVIEFLVNETSKLKSLVLEMPKDEEIQ